MSQQIKIISACTGLLFLTAPGVAAISAIRHPSQDANQVDRACDPEIGKLVVGHDANTLGTATANDSSAQFAVNLANFLMCGTAGRLLLLETEPLFASHNYATGVVNALLDAGFQVTVVDAANHSAELSDFDAVFFGIAARDFYVVPDAIEFIDFVRSGGGAYVYGGVGGDRIAEATVLNDLIAGFGIHFLTDAGPGSGGYNGLQGVMVDPNAHPVFAGINALPAGNGQWLETDTSVPLAITIAEAGGRGVYGAAEVLPCLADFASPLGTLDLADINAFTTGFVAMDPIADLNADGLFDLADINLFVSSFVAGCP